MAIFAISGEQIEVEVTGEATSLSLIIPNAKHLHIFMPNNVAAFAAGSKLVSLVACNFHKSHTKEFFEDFEHALNRG